MKGVEMNEAEAWNAYVDIAHCKWYGLEAAVSMRLAFEDRQREASAQTETHAGGQSKA